MTVLNERMICTVKTISSLHELKNFPYKLARTITNSQILHFTPKHFSVPINNNSNQTTIYTSLCKKIRAV